jgi:oligoendopeptidase F
MSELTTLPERSQVPAEQTWNLESIFPTPADWETACSMLEGELPSLEAYQGRLAEGPATLWAFLDLYQRSAAIVDRIFVYAFNAFSVDTSNSDAAARLGQARSLFARHAAAVAFLNPELVAIGFERLRQWVQAVPELAFLDHFLDRLGKLQEHLASDQVEQVLALVTDPFSSPSSIYSMLNNADLTFEPATSTGGEPLEVGQSSIDELLSHPDRQVRQSAWQNYADGYLAFKNTFAATLIASLEQDVFNMRVRRFPSTLHASLETNFIPVEVFHNLVAVFQENLPTWQRYWRVRRKALGYDRLHVWDVEAPLTGGKPIVPYPQAVDWICEGLAPLGEEYTSVLRRGCLEERWVDRACNKGKRQGAYSSGAYGTRPFILMSYVDDLFSLSTLAHELGHSLHSYHAGASQPYLYSEYGLFVAEVASNFNQAMVRDYLFRTQPEKSFQIALIEEAMSNYHRYFFLMPTLARFELEVHARAERGAALSAVGMIDLMTDLFSEGYGSEVEFDRQRVGITWAQFGHLYQGYYVYQYGTGISGAHALARRVLDGVPGAANHYLDFLKAGASCYPLDALRLAGVDLSSPEPVRVAFANLASLVERLEGLVG